MYIREIKIRTNFGKINLVNAYINTVNITKANTTWFTKKNGTNCGISMYLLCLDTFLLCILTLKDF
jgi:hypothetical protein